MPFKFDTTVGLGHALVILTLMISVVAAWIANRERTLSNASNIAEHETALIRVNDRLDILNASDSVLTSRLDRAADRLSSIEDLIVGGVETHNTLEAGLNEIVTQQAVTNEILSRVEKTVETIRNQGSQAPPRVQ